VRFSSGARTRRACVVAALCLVHGAGCHPRKKNRGTVKEAIQTQRSEPPAQMGDVSSAPKTVRDVSYGSDPAQTFDVYLPPQPEKAPVLFVVHGGAWQYGDKAHAAVVTNKVKHWVPKGYIVVSTNYRLAPPDPLRQADDVGKALAFAQSQCESWGGDPDRFVLLGHSSGAHLVSLLASDPSIASKHEAKPWLGAVVLDSAAFDVERIMSRRHFPFYDRVFPQDPAYWRDCSPMHRLKAQPKPLFAVCSSDRRMSCVQAGAFVEKVTAMGGRAQVLPLALSHQEINEQLGTAGHYTNAVDSFLNSLGLP
jgi:acetyl esterase/lipase